MVNLFLSLSLTYFLNLTPYSCTIHLISQYGSPFKMDLIYITSTLNCTISNAPLNTPQMTLSYQSEVEREGGSSTKSRRGFSSFGEKEEY